MINPVNNDNKCFQYATIVALNYEQIGKHPQRISKINSFTNKHNWKVINHPSGKDDWR